MRILKALIYNLNYIADYYAPVVVYAIFPVALIAAAIISTFTQ